MLMSRRSAACAVVVAMAIVSMICPSVRAQAPAPASGAAPVAGVASPPAAEPVFAPVRQREGDVAGAWGVGVGVVAGTSFIKPDTSVLTFKYWKNEDLAVVPRLRFAAAKEKDQMSTWSLEASTLLSFVLLRRGATRLAAGGGLGVALANDQYPATAVNTDTHLGLLLPVEIGVEHFFASWFSMGISASFNLLDVWKQGDAWAMNVEIGNTEFLGSVFFYAN